jgi:hypothetical protein
MIRLELFSENDCDTLESVYTVRVYIKNRELPYVREYLTRASAENCIDWLEGLYLALDIPVEVWV